MHDGLAIVGTLRAWERPDGMDVNAFLALPAAELGPPLAEASNIVVNTWFQDVLTVMSGGTANLQVGVLALGTGSMSGLPTRTDGAMVNEWHRYVPTSTSVGATDPISATFSFFSPAADGAASLTEAGMFHGGATTAVGSGRMSTHLAWTYSKSGATDTRLDYTLTRSLT